MVRDGGLTWGGEHTVQCADDVLWNCAPKTCIILLTGVTNKFNKKWETCLSRNFGRLD